MKASKCLFFKREVSFLGHIISSDYHLYSSNTLSIPKFVEQASKKIGEMRKSLGLDEYFHKHIKISSKLDKLPY